MGTITITFPSLLPSLVSVAAFAKIGFFVILFLLGLGITVWMHLRLADDEKNGKKSASKFSIYYSIVSMIGMLFFAIVMVQQFRPMIQDYQLIHLHRSSDMAPSWFKLNSKGKSDGRDLSKYKFDFSPSALV